MPKQDLILVIILATLLVWIGKNYFQKRKKNDHTILEKLRNSRSKFQAEDITTTFTYNLKGHIHNSRIYFRNKQIIIVGRKSFLFFPSYNVIYLIGKSTHHFPKELFENHILIDKLEHKDKLLRVKGFFKTEKVISSHNEPTDGDFITLTIPIRLDNEKIKSLLLECDLVNGC